MLFNFSYFVREWFGKGGLIGWFEGGMLIWAIGMGFVWRRSRKGRRGDGEMEMLGTWGDRDWDHRRWGGNHMEMEWI